MWTERDCEFSRETDSVRLRISATADRAEIKRVLQGVKWGSDDVSACKFEHADKMLRGVYMRAQARKPANPGQTGRGP